MFFVVGVSRLVQSEMVKDLKLIRKSFNQMPNVLVPVNKRKYNMFLIIKMENEGKAVPLVADLNFKMSIYINSLFIMVFYIFFRAGYVR